MQVAEKLSPILHFSNEPWGGRGRKDKEIKTSIGLASLTLIEEVPERKEDQKPMAAGKKEKKRRERRR